MKKRKPNNSAAEEKLQVVLKRLKVEKTRCVDTESSGLDWKRNHIVGYVVTFGPDPRDSYYVPVRHLGNANVGGHNGPTTPFNWDGKLAPGEAELIQALDRSGTMMFGHNFGFDLRFMFKTARIGGAKFDLNGVRCEDTIINEPLLNEFAPKFSLDATAQRYGVQAKKGALLYAHIHKLFPEAPNDQKAMGHYWRLAGDDPLAVEYAEGDGTSTWQLRDKQMVEIFKEEMDGDIELPTLEGVWDVESRLIPVLARMSVRGIRVNEEKLLTLHKTIKSGLEQLYNEFPPDFNARSPGDVKEWMTRHGCTDWPTTPPSIKFPNGQPSMAKIWLDNHDAGKKIIKVRKLETLRDTFALPLQTTHMFKGRVHTNYNQLRGDEYGTITGRLSSDGPNLQAVPKHDEEIGFMFREVFDPDDDKIWGSPDYNQCEPRLLAYFSRCKVLFDGYMADPPLDAHTAAAIACNKNWHNLDAKAQKFYRNEYAKRINQTIITGGGKNVLVTKYKVDPKEVDKVWSDYFRAMPEVRTIQQRMQKRMERRGFILTLLGRRCRLRDRSKSYVALNRALQGGNADIIKLKMVEVDDYLENVGRPIDMLNNCHDAVDFQFDEEHRGVYENCLNIMQDFSSPDAAIKLDIPVPVDGGEGPNWAVATYGEKK